VSAFEPAPCLLCGGQRLIPLARRGQFGLPARVAICPRDGLVFLSPRWTRSEYLRFYAEDYDRHYRPEVFGVESEEERYAQARQVGERLTRLGLLAGRQRALDVGSGMGWTLDWLRRLEPSLELSAVEASPRCRENLRQLGVEVLSLDIEGDWAPGSYDLVVLRHVLEHLFDPIATLRKIAGRLAPGGVVYLAAPDMLDPRGSLRRRLFRAVHTYYYSAPTLEEICARAGLRPLALESEGGELWGVFEVGGDASFEPPGPEHFRRQLGVILQHRLRTLPEGARHQLRLARLRLFGEKS
jgi:SAM-dependent methyltransferase